MLALGLPALLASLDALQGAHARQMAPMQCENTEAGRHYIADSQGFVCPRSGMDYTTGCCLPGAGTQHSCETCRDQDRCCASYEHCVSCCMAPQHRAGELLQQQFRIHGADDTGRWATEFQFCSGKCRTHKRCTAHENRYIDDRHFCFSDTGRPQTAPLPALPEGVSLHVSERGKDCHAACAATGACVEGPLEALESCDVLREHFECEAGCEAAGGSRAEAPSYVAYGTPKAQFPTMCFALARGARLRCDGAAGPAQRLCACSAGSAR